MTSIVTATRSTATHVFLTEGMRRQFETLYGKTHSLICTNAVYVEDDIDTPIPMTEMAPRLRLGHLSNLCRAKGYYDVVDTFEGLLSVGVDCELHLAGPVVEPQVSNGIETLRRRHGNRVSYEGAVYGASKASFYQGIDVFLFPTDYPEEAAPNVLYEALAHGVPVIAKRRGCIEDIVANVNVGSVFDAKIFVTSAIETIRRLKVDPDSRIARSRTIREHITQEVALSTAQHRHLLQLIAESQW
jgi:glycosyltransferase involved in cell wall biosynthesis